MSARKGFEDFCLELGVEALKVYNSTGLMPRELNDHRRILRAALRCAVDGRAGWRNEAKALLVKLTPDHRYDTDDNSPGYGDIDPDDYAPGSCAD